MAVAQYLSYAQDFYVQFREHYPVGSVFATGFAIAVPILYYIYNKNLQYWTFNLNDWTSVEIEKGVRCNKAVLGKPLVESLDHKIKGKNLVKTVYDCFMHGIEVSRNKGCMGRMVDNFTRYEWITYGDVEKQSRLVGRLLRARGVERQQCVGIYAVNSAEWVMAQMACVLQSIVTVPLYDTLGPESIRHTINEVEMPVLFCDSEEKLKKIVAERKNFPSLKMFVLLHDKVQDAKFADACKAEGIELLTWSQAKNAGAEHPEIKDDIPSPDDLFLIQYTSGTTGISKGFMLTHRNFAAEIAGAGALQLLLGEKGMELVNNNDRMLFYMPLAHGYGQTALGVMLTHRNMVADIAGAAGMQHLLEEKGLELLNELDRMFFYLPLAHGYGQTAMVCFIFTMWAEMERGDCKGVMLTHHSIVAQLAGFDALPEIIHYEGDKLSPSDRLFNYLPLAHAYAQTATVWFLYAGGQIGFSSGNVARLVQDMQLLKPTYMPLVPRIMNRVYTKVIDETKSGLKGWLFRFAYERKRALFRQGCLTRSSVWDWLVFGKLQKMLGGEVRFMTTGSAPIAVEVLEFWRVVFGSFIMEGYGQTESTAAATGAIDTVGGTVGHPILCNHIKLLDLPELGYTTSHNPPQGEICIRGPNVMKGYYKREDLTKEAFTSDGWLLTGDIGEFLPDGSLRMIDRRKHIFKLAQGEYVAPEKIESIYAQCPIVAQVFVEGNSLQPYIIAIVVPEEKIAKEWAAEHGQSKASFEDICQNKDFKRYVLDALLAIGKEKKLNSLEQAKSIYLYHEAFSVANGLLTPSLKNRRNDLRRRFQDEIDAVYKAGPIIQSSRD